MAKHDPPDLQPGTPDPSILKTGHKRLLEERQRFHGLVLAIQQVVAAA